MEKIKNIEVREVFNRYPSKVCKKLMFLRQLILDTTSETKDVNTLEKSLRWGEPSYLTKSGSTIRLGWKKSRLDQYAMYFNCKSKLVDTFKEIYGDSFKFEGNRAIIFFMDDKIPIIELKHCISLVLTYHSRKHLPMLGI
jgi:hypothetical protein